jgi:serine/threonine protein kinase/WD40 repeat protein
LSTPDQTREEEVFQMAQQIDSIDRAAFLEAECEGDDLLRERIEDLLRATEGTNGILDHVPDDSVLDTGNLMNEPEDKTIGNYKLLEKIGEGGFGVVYLADQLRPVKRKVALKVIKPGMDCREVVARFEAERQALAMMEHSHIAKVLDGGSTKEGRPYFVMELVKGSPITTYCDDNQMSIADRLRQFINVCEAVQHAHQKGIIHRDVKPSNVLITIRDGKPTVKVIDFGIAKAMHGELTEMTLFTMRSQIIGTPQYMSPEQAEMNGLDVDTRSDIYSLAVLLYELITGTTPLASEDLRNAGYAGMQKMIKECEPPKPSTRLGFVGDQITHIAQRRNSSPDRLRKMVSGDLDWIVMKALEKDRTRRYETAIGFAAEIQRFLAGEIVEARPPTTTYRFRKLVARHKREFAAAGTMLFAAIVAFVGISVGWRNAHVSFENTKKALAEKNSALSEKDSAIRREVAANYALQSELAFLALHERNRRSFEQLLSDMPKAPAIQGFEYFFLRSQLENISVPEIDVGGVATTVAFDHLSGDKLIVARIDGLVQSFDLRRPMQEPLTIDARGTIAAVSANGRYFAAGGIDDPVHLFNLETSIDVPISGDDIYAVDLRFSDDGRYLACLSQDGQVEIVSVAERRRTTRSGQNPDDANTIRSPGHGQLGISASGRYVAAAISNRGLLWDRETNRDVRFSALEVINGLQFIGDDSLLVTSEFDIQKFDLAGGQLQPLEMPELGLHPTCAAISPDGSTLAIGCANFTVWVGNADTFEEYSRLPHRNYLVSVAFSRDGKRLAAGGRDNRVLLWPKETWVDRHKWQGVRSAEPPLFVDSKRNECLSTRLSPNSHHYQVVATELDSLDQEIVVEQDVSLGMISAIAVSPLDGAVATGTDDGHIRLWSREKRPQLMADWKAHSDDGVVAFQVRTHLISDLTFSSDGRWLYSSGKGPEISRWDMTSSVEIGEMPQSRAVLDDTDSWISDIDLSEDHGLLVAAGGCKPRSGFTAVWELSDLGSSPKWYKHKEWNRRVALSPSGLHIACQEDFSASLVSLINLKSGRRDFEWSGHSSKTVALAFDPTGRRIATGSDDGTIKLWDVESKTGTSIGTLRVGQRIRRLEFADSATLVSASWEGTVRVWKAPVK